MQRTWYDWTMMGLTAVGVILFAASIIVPIAVNKKVMTVELISRSKLSESFSGATRNRTTFLIDDRPVDDLTVFQFRFHNTGRKTIETADYDERPLHLSFSDIEKTLYAVKTTSQPKGLLPKFRVEDRSVFIEPFGMNEGASYVLETGIDHKENQHPRVELLGQIVGAKLKYLDTSASPTEVSRVEPKRTIGVLLGIFITFVAGLTGYYARRQIRFETRSLAVPRLLQWMNHNRRNFDFYSAKFLREKVFRKDPDMQSALQFGIDSGLLETYEVDNPKHPEFPTTAVRINHEHALYKKFVRSS